MALHDQWVSQKKVEGQTKQNKAGTWKSHHHWELEALHRMLLGGSSLKLLWTNGLCCTIHHPVSSCIDLQFGSVSTEEMAIGLPSSHAAV